VVDVVVAATVEAVDESVDVQGAVVVIVVVLFSFCDTHTVAMVWTET